MSSNKNKYPHTAFYGIGIMHGTNAVNIGTLWRHAYIMGASFIFTVDRKYKKHPSRIPLYHYRDIDDLKAHLPYGAPLVAVELTEDAVLVNDFHHPARAVYLLGSETNGLSDKVLQTCHSVVKLPGHFSMNVAVAGSIVMHDFSMNVAVAGSIVMHDRISKIPHVLPQRGQIG